MGKRKSEIITIAKRYRHVLEEVIDVDEIRLFGSYYKGTPHRWSDIDLAVVSPDFRGMDYVTAIKILNRLRLRVTDEIEAIPMTREDMKVAPLGSIEYEIRQFSKKIA